jgi:plasmid stabilization system protein ParE
VRSALCQHHRIFGLVSAEGSMMVLAVLHERMDLMERLKARL